MVRASDELPMLGMPVARRWRSLWKTTSHVGSPRPVLTKWLCGSMLKINSEVSTCCLAAALLL